ncbi:helix-turn-helix domain-containing protein [Streptomyces cellulosae]
MAAAQRDIWKSSQLQTMLADAGLVISAGKMSNLWAGQPVTIRLDDLDVICEVLGCEPNDLFWSGDIRSDGQLTTQKHRQSHPCENHWCPACSADGLTSYRESAA